VVTMCPAPLALYAKMALSALHVGVAASRSPGGGGGVGKDGLPTGVFGLSMAI